MKDRYHYAHNIYDILFEPILYKNNLCLITELPIHINQIKNLFTFTVFTMLITMGVLK